jgi:Flp pilus assembly pilin Flp
MTLEVEKRKSWINRFVADESGAVTVDWVVLTAAVVGLGVLLFSILTPAVFEEGGIAIAEAVNTAASRP